MLLASCPAPAELEQFALGQVVGPRSNLLEQHIECCEPCGTAIQQLKIEDALVRALAAPAVVGAPRPEYLAPLIERLCRIPQEAARPAVDTPSPAEPLATPAGAESAMVLGIPSPKRSDRFEFLAPPQGPDELGRTVSSGCWARGVWASSSRPKR